MDVDPETGKPPVTVIHTALCGRKMADAGAFILATAWSGMTADQVLEEGRSVTKYPNGTRPWVGVDEYAYGEDGCEAINCVPCRERLDDALARFWGS